MQWISNHAAHPGGRSLILWDSSHINVTIDFMSIQIINLLVYTDDRKFLVSAIYAFNDEHCRTICRETLLIKAIPIT